MKGRSREEEEGKGGGGGGGAECLKFTLRFETSIATTRLFAFKSISRLFELPNPRIYYFIFFLPFNVQFKQKI